MFLSIVQLVVVSVLSLVLAIFKETIVFADIMSVIWPLLAIGVLSSGVGYTLQIVGQKDVPPHTASLNIKFRVCCGCDRRSSYSW